MKCFDANLKENQLKIEETWKFIIASYENEKRGGN